LIELPADLASYKNFAKMWKAIINRKVKTNPTDTTEDGATIEMQEAADIPNEDHKIS